VVRSLWGRNHVDWLCLGSRGVSEGILVMWDRRVVEKIEECGGRLVVACSFICIVENFEWAWSRIDRFLLCLEWEEYFSVVSQRRLPRLLSDHFPLILDCGVGE
jgi:hypothetical protein